MANESGGASPDPQAVGANTGGAGAPAPKGAAVRRESDGLGDQLSAVNWSLVILLIFAGGILFAIFQDSQVLRRLQDPAYARGVITFLIALAAIGLAFMFVYQAFVGGSTSEAGFQRGREVLSGLMGVLGTIVGFYFGSSDKTGTAHFGLAVTQEGTVLVAHATGGTPPYRGAVTFEPKDVRGVDNLQSKDGWITVPLPAGTRPTKATFELEDAKDLKATSAFDLKVASVATGGAKGPEAAQPVDSVKSGETERAIEVPQHK